MALADVYNEMITKYWNEDIKRKEIREILSGISDKKYDIVLDLGCGGGKLTTLLDGEIKAGHIYGVDSSEEMIAFAKQNNTKENITYIRGDVGLEFECLTPELKALEGQVSLIFTKGVLNLIPKDNLMTTMYRLLSKGGEICAHITCNPNPYCKLRGEEKAIIEREFLKIPDFRTQMTDFHHAFKSVGFHVVSNEWFEYKRVMTLEDFKQFMVPIGLSIFVQYYVRKDEAQEDVRCEQLTAAVIECCRHFTDETSGKAMVEFDWMHFIIRLRK